MAKRTLLALTNSILSEMDSDEVNSIEDTLEAAQVVDRIRACYIGMVEELDLPSKKQLFTLEEASTSDFPTRVKIPDAASDVEWVKYARTSLNDDSELVKVYTDIAYKCPSDFIYLIDQRPVDADYIQMVEYPFDSDIQLAIQNNKFPDYWTSFDDEHVWFDSWDSAASTTIVANHTKAFGQISPEFVISDEFIPDLPANLFPYLEAKARTLCIALHKQEVNPVVIQTENRARIRTQRNKYRASRNTVPSNNYGRK